MIWEHIRTQAASLGRRVALVADQREITYAELSSLVSYEASKLPAPHPNNRTQRVFVHQSDSFSSLISVLACWSRGKVPVVLRESMPQRHVQELTRRLKPCASLSGGISSSATEKKTDAILSRLKFTERDEALIMFTSGTTGIPRPVALPAESVCLNAATITSSLGLTGNDRIAVNTPLGYMYGLMGGCIASLWAGATTYLFNPREPLTQLQAGLARNGITVVQGPPSVFRLFMAYADGAQFPGVRLVTTGGEAFSDQLMADLERTFPDAVKLALYGMTEAGPRISHERFDTGGGKDGCVGAPYSHFEWRLDAVDGHESLSNAGRLALRGPSMLLGYIGTNGDYKGLDAEGFFHSNDLVSVDPAGRFHFHGRIDRVFKSGGKLVSPDAIERILRQHGNVAEAVVRAAEHPLLGLVPEAEVIPAGNAVFDAMELMEFVRQNAEPHAVPRVIRRAAGRLGESGKLARATSRIAKR